jgi:hypothetical protein
MKPSPPVDEELLELGQRLIREHDTIAAGSVLRCLARAIREARSWGCPPGYLLSTIEASTRWHLAQRLGAAAPEARASLSRPRQGGLTGMTA